MKQSELAAMVALDDGHWWYRGRRAVLCAELDRLPLPAGARILDAGCGSGRTLDELRRYGAVRGAELDAVALAAARRRGHEVVQAPVEDLPFPDAEFDLVTCLDVIEHTDDDVRALRELLRVTRPGGFLLVTVPAYPALWSAHDVANQHRRRYTLRALRGAARRAGWDVARTTGFNALLLLPAAAVRLARRRADPGESSELRFTPGALNSVLERPLRAEARLLRRGGRLPGGLSLLAVLRSPIGAVSLA